MARNPKNLIAILVTGSTIAVATLFAWLLFKEYHANPWTRDAHVRANIIDIAPRVAGPIVQLNVRDNQKVTRGQLLFAIDPTDFQNSFEMGQAAYARSGAEFIEAQQDFARFQKLFETRVISRQEFDAATATFQSAKAAYDGAGRALRQAQLNLTYTKIYAPANGYVTGVTFGLGTYVETGKPLFALVDSDDFWIEGLFKETVLPSLQEGRPVEIRFATHPTAVYHGMIESLGPAIFDMGAAHQDLLPNIAPTVDWVRLTERFPIRVRLDADAKKLPLKVGVTASLRVIGEMAKPLVASE